MPIILAQLAVKAQKFVDYAYAVDQPRNRLRLTPSNISASSLPFSMFLHGVRCKGFAAVALVQKAPAWPMRV